MENAPSVLKIIIACDDQDEVLGNYFKACKDDIEGFLTEQKNNGFPLEIVQIIDSDNCHAAYIDLQLNAYQNQPLLMIAYSHGLEHSLRCKSAGYIASHNIHLLFNAFFYTNACLVASVLGKEFASKQGAFIGFDKKVRAFHNDVSLMKASVDCDNCGLKYMFCHPQASVGEIYRKMKGFYNQLIDRYTDLSYNIVTIQTLRRTMNSLKIYGDVNLTLQNYIQ